MALEIQEPTVIRDAAVLMALNSALEPDGSLNLPTRIAHRHLILCGYHNKPRLQWLPALK